MDKRGVSVSLIFAIFSIAAAGAFFWGGYTIAKTIATGEDIQREFLAKDSALLIDAYHAVSGDVDFNYNVFNSTENIKMSLFLDHSVQVVPEFGPITIFPFRPGIPRIFMEEIQLEAQKQNILEFSKNESKIEIKKKVQQ